MTNPQTHVVASTVQKLLTQAETAITNSAVELKSVSVRVSINSQGEHIAMGSAQMSIRIFAKTSECEI